MADLTEAQKRALVKGRSREVRQKAKISRMKKSEIRENPKKENIGYLAGLLDSDGNISLKERGGRTLTTSVKFSNTCERCLEKIQKILGTGSINEVSDPDPNHKQSYYLKIDGQKSILDLLNQILPYIVIKRKQGNLLRKYMRDNLRNSLDDRKREKYLTRMRELNKRGGD